MVWDEGIYDHFLGREGYISERMEEIRERRIRKRIKPKNDRGK